MKKRVVQFIGSFNSGGSERQAISLTRMLREDGTFDVRIATLNDEGVLKPEVDALDLSDVPEFALTSFYDVNFLRQVRRCARYLRENEFDIVHTHDFYTNIFGMAAATLARVPVKIASKRETGGMRSRGQRSVEKIAFRCADAIVANSNAVSAYLMSQGIGKDKINLVYNGIHPAPYSGEPDRLGLNGLGPVLNGEVRLITLVANLRHPVKNVPMFLRAAKRVAEHDDSVHFVIAGEGELRDELQGLAVRLGVARNVHFIGRCDDVPSLLAASYACALTSRAEGFSNSLVEYMAAGKPVVATKVGGAAEAIVHGQTGYLVPSDDHEAMAERLLELLDKRDKARDLGERGKIVAAERFSKNNQLNSTLMLYERLLQR